MITLTPAYGRDFKSGKAAIQAWNDGKDFIINSFGHRYDGKPINRPQAQEAGEQVRIRFNGSRGITKVID